MRASLPCAALVLTVGLSLATAAPIRAEPQVSYQITVEAGPHDRQNLPVRAEVLVPASWAGKAQVTLTGPGEKKVPAQLTPPDLLDRGDPPPRGVARQVVWWMLPKLAARQSAVHRAVIAPGTGSPAGFAWADTPGKHTDLLFGKRRVLRYVYQAYDNDPARRDLNNKPFHHLFDPTGQRLVTKGSGGFETHHQGLFFGFTRCTFEGGACNTWYCHDGEHELHRRFLDQRAGPVLGRHRLEIDWNDRQGKRFAAEVRELTAYATPGGTLVEFASRLRSTRGTVTLDGDPHHAGFQFRAADEVSRRRNEVYFVRPGGKGRQGEERNGKAMTNLPWDAMSFPLGKARYTAVYIDHPRNPRPSFSSERLYGRFGSSIGKQVLRADGPPLELRYRVWLQEGELTVEQAAALARAFAEPPTARVAAKK
jgi:hypothetical protein